MFPQNGARGGSGSYGGGGSSGGSNNGSLVVVMAAATVVVVRAAAAVVAVLCSRLLKDPVIDRTHPHPSFSEQLHTMKKWYVIVNTD